MLLSQRTRRCRELTGPTPHSVAVRAKFPSSKPLDYLIRERQKQDAIRDKALEFSKHQQMWNIKTTWLKSSEDSFLRGTIKRGVQAALSQQEVQIQEKRDRLRVMLETEEQQLLQEIEEKMETSVERQAKMRERAKTLRDKRERERQQLVTDKLEQLFREQCEELRSAQSRNMEKQVSERNVYKINKTILLVGETGAGKSTLINALVNFNMGVKWEDDVWFQIVEDERRDQTESQTSDVTVYQVFGFEGKTLPFSLTIIDTPGYGSTGGKERDAITRERLFDLFSSDDGVQEIDAVGLVMKASENRLTDRLMYVFDSVMSLFGKDMEKNIVVLMTHSDFLPPTNALRAVEASNFRCAKDEKYRPVYFLFNNCQSEEKTLGSRSALKYAWDLTTKGLSEFTDLLKHKAPQNLKTTMDVLDKRRRLTGCIYNLQ